ncbi:hypothetical protein [Kocuria rosea]|uniref:hypothetical protein n=1 Tax=Kocuria rosea TaxID=1275 RepID=UPI00232FCFFD|nr:hypothetical protein [Kocuria rosea]
MTEGVIALIGVIVGGLITVLGETFISARGHGTERRRADTELLAEFLAATDSVWMHFFIANRAITMREEAVTDDARKEANKVFAEAARQPLDIHRMDQALTRVELQIPSLVTSAQDLRKAVIPNETLGYILEEVEGSPASPSALMARSQGHYLKHGAQYQQARRHFLECARKHLQVHRSIRRY